MAGARPELGAGVPEEVDAAGAGDDYRRALEVSRAEYERLRSRRPRAEALYALCLGYRIRYVLDLNAREAMHLIELRSVTRATRATAPSRTRCTARSAGPPRRRRAMRHVDTTAEPRLERILSEMRAQAKLDALATR